MNRFTRLIGMVALVTALTTAFGARAYQQSQSSSAEVQQSAVKKLPKKLNVKRSPSKKATSPAKTVNWRAPSENKPYPNVDKYPKLSVKVSVAKQRVYLMNGTQILYTMRASTGSKKSPTPKGNFQIQAERGQFFYNAQSGEGAKDYVSFKDHGVYLFHSVPTDRNGNFIKAEAEQLGKEGNSHGCVRLSVSDAKWFFNNIKEGTKVQIS